MIKWLKRNQDTPNKPVQPTNDNILSRFQKGFQKTRAQLSNQLGQLLLGKKELNAELLEELETLLLMADLGIETTQTILKQLTNGMERKQLANGDAAYLALKSELQTILSNVSHPLTPELEEHKPFVILMVGINGAGKTTTIGKLAQHYKQTGKKVMLAAGDTFRAAAVEQLQAWGERNEIPVIAQHTGADSASVIFDALQASKARGIDILIADTAGRLHTQRNLMDELKKIKRVLHKLDPNAPHETLLVLDASIGQNALKQAQTFHQEIGVSGIAITKLDGTAKGGILFAIAHQLGIPFRYIGVGEGINDLQEFDASTFIEAMFHDDNIQSSQ